MEKKVYSRPLFAEPEIDVPEQRLLTPLQVDTKVDGSWIVSIAPTELDIACCANGAAAKVTIVIIDPKAPSILY